MKDGGTMLLFACPECGSSNCGVWKCSNSPWFVRCWSCFREGPRSWDVEEAKQGWNNLEVGRHGKYYHDKV